jgi:hypothetical protein
MKPLLRADQEFSQFGELFRTFFRDLRRKFIRHGLIPCQGFAQRSECDPEKTRALSSGWSAQTFRDIRANRCHSPEELIRLVWICPQSMQDSRIFASAIEQEQADSIRVKFPYWIAPQTFSRGRLPSAKLGLMDDWHEGKLAYRPAAAVTNPFPCEANPRRTFDLHFSHSHYLSLSPTPTISHSHYLPLPLSPTPTISHSISLSSLKLPPILLQLIPPTQTHLSSLRAPPVA